jgi:hypothetical protein
MAMLYLVTESHRDALFYQKCATRLRGSEFSWVAMHPYRKVGDGGSAQVQKHLRFALIQARSMAQGEEAVCLIAAIDNDRTPHEENRTTLQRHKLSEQEARRPSRLQWIESTVANVLGDDQGSLRIALAVPVEMVEAWIVKALGPEIPTHQLPHFSRQAQPKAQKYYQPNQAPPQWKDLERQARMDCGWDDDEQFYEHAATEIAARAAEFSANSVSFKHFHDQICGWP